MTTKIEDRVSRIEGVLYGVLLRKLPLYKREDGNLDVRRLRIDLKMSHEGVYKWLRSGRLSPAAVGKLVDLSNSPANLEKLAENSEAPATRDDFVDFIFA